VFKIRGPDRTTGPVYSRWGLKDKSLHEAFGGWAEGGEGFVRQGNNFGLLEIPHFLPEGVFSLTSVKRGGKTVKEKPSRKKPRNSKRQEKTLHYPHLQLKTRACQAKEKGTIRSM